MTASKLQSVKEIAQIHLQRIDQALNHLQGVFPVSEDSIENLTDEQFVYMELLTSRFSKLQDHLGSNMFEVFFQMKNENVETLTMIDKLNKLEKFGIIDDAYLWRKMRDARNIIAHEYPDNLKLVADTLNLIHGYCDDLKIVYDRLVASLKV